MSIITQNLQKIVLDDGDAAHICDLLLANVGERGYAVYILTRAGMSVRQIARVLGSSRGTVGREKKRIARFVKTLGDHGGT